MHSLLCRTCLSRCFFLIMEHLDHQDVVIMQLTKHIEEQYEEVMRLGGKRAEEPVKRHWPSVR